MKYELFRTQKVNIFIKLWHQMLGRSWYWLKSHCNFATKKSWMITFLSFFFLHSFSINHVKSQIVNRFMKLWHEMLVWNWFWLKSYCNFETKNSLMIPYLSFFFIHSFFINHVKSLTMKYELYRTQKVNIFTKLWYQMLVRSWCWLKSYCNFATKNSWMIAFQTFFLFILFS